MAHNSDKGHEFRVIVASWAVIALLVVFVGAVGFNASSSKTTSANVIDNTSILEENAILSKDITVLVKQNAKRIDQNSKSIDQNAKTIDQNAAVLDKLRGSCTP